MSSISSFTLSSTAIYKQIIKQGESTAVAKYVKQTPTVTAAEKAFTKSVSQYKSPNDLFSHYNDLKYVLTALGETSQIGNIGLLKKVVASDASSSTSLVNKLNDSGLTLLNKVLNTDSTVTASLQDSSIQDELKNAYELSAYQTNLSSTNAAVAPALNFGSQITSVTSIYDILGNSTLRSVVATVGHIPDTIVNQSLEAQAAAFAKVFDVTKVNDKNYVSKFIQRYLGTSDANAAQSSSSSSSNPILSLFSSSSSSNGITSIDTGLLTNYVA
jgi:hypothetical protein